MLKVFLKYIVFLLLVSSMLIGGNLHVLGPFSTRHICMFVLFILYIFDRMTNGYNTVTVEVNCIKLYIIYIFIYAFCNVLNGEFTTPKFLQSFYTYHIPCISIVLGMQALVKSKKDLTLIIVSIITLYLANILLSLLQYLNYSPAWAIAMAISSSAEEGIESAELYNNAYGNIMGYSIVMGMFGFVVTNGYFLASYLPIASNKIQKSRLNTIIGLLVIGLGVVTVYILQQRMAFLLVLLYIFYLITIRVQSKAVLFIIGLVMVCAWIISSDSLGSIDMGRLTTTTSNDNRISIFNDFADYISKPNSFFGGQEAYHNKYHKYQHNTFTASWVAGGFFTFVVFCILYFKLFKNSFKVLWERRKENSIYPYSISFALSSMLFLLYSTTHTEGVHSGSPMFWLSYTLMFYAINLENNIIQYASNFK